MMMTLTVNSKIQTESDRPTETQTDIRTHILYIRTRPVHAPLFINPACFADFTYYQSSEISNADDELADSLNYIIQI